MYQISSYPLLEEFLKKLISYTCLCLNYSDCDINQNEDMLEPLDITLKFKDVKIVIFYNKDLDSIISFKIIYKGHVIRILNIENIVNGKLKLQLTNLQTFEIPIDSYSQGSLIGSLNKIKSRCKSYLFDNTTFYNKEYLLQLLKDFTPLLENNYVL